MAPLQQSAYGSRQISNAMENIEQQKLFDDRPYIVGQFVLPLVIDNGFGQAEHDPFIDGLPLGQYESEDNNES